MTLARVTIPSPGEEGRSPDANIRCSILRVATPMLEVLRFLWNATRGHRLRPWRSPYLRWRLETYSGLHAEAITARDFWHFLLSERRQLLRFAAWLSEMRTYASSPTQPEA